jgi:hypothetical protein
VDVTNSSAWLNELLGEHEPPCVSIYMPFARNKPLSEQNRILFKDLVKRADSQVRARYPHQIADEILGKLEQVAHSDTLREGPRDGLAVFASPGVFRMVDLPRPVNATVEVADSFHVRPLIRMMQQGARFSVLCVSLNNVRVLEGDPYQMTEVPLENVPRNINETLKGLKGDYPNEPYGEQRMRDHQPPTDKDNMGVEPFLRAVDHAVWEHYSRTARLPMIVCADEKHLRAFLEMTKNEEVMEQGIQHNPDHLSGERIRDEAWKIMEPRYREEMNQLIDQFRVAKAHHRGSDELMEVTEAAANGRVGTLLIDEQAKIPGVLHRATGFVESPRGQDPAKVEDVLDDLAEMVLQMDGQVYVIPHEQMPTDAGLAAMYRY